MIAHAHDPSPSGVRRKLTENSVRVSDKRVRFVGLDAYVEAGGSVVRDLFETDHGGWLTDVGLLDRLVAAKLEAEALRIGGDGWKWVDAAEEPVFNPGRGLWGPEGDRAARPGGEEKGGAGRDAEGGAQH